MTMPDICLSWLFNGVCSKGVKCEQQHHMQGVKKAEERDNKRKSVLCRHWMEGSCRYRGSPSAVAACNFSHSITDLYIFEGYAHSTDERQSL